MNVIKSLKVAVLAISLAIVLGCASLGLPTATTFNEKLAGGYTGVTVVLQTTDQLLQAGKIGPIDAKNVEAQADNVKAALDIARTVNATNSTDGGNKLVSALAGLASLQNYLATKK